MSHFSSEVQKLYPKQQNVPLQQIVDQLPLPTVFEDQTTPYLLCNMVVTLDGRTAINDRSRELSSPCDRALFHLLRTRVDAVIVGANTVRTERYGKMIRDQELQQSRVAINLDPNPPICIFSKSLDIPPDLPLMSDPTSKVIIITPAKEVPGKNFYRAQVEFLQTENLTTHQWLSELRTRYNIRLLLCEGGPVLNGLLAKENLIDELFITLSPQIVGENRSSPLVGGNKLPNPSKAELIWTLQQEGTLFLRYKLVQ